MIVSVFASGSSGNCALLSEGETHLLIDAGISLRRTAAALRQAGHSIDEVTGVLMTHEHSDHVCGLPMLIKSHPLPVFAPHTVANRPRGMYPVLEDVLRIIPTEEAFPVGSLRVTAFHNSHDTDECVGYRFEGRGVYGHATDTGVVTEGMRRYLAGADTVLLESNHDVELLLAGRYPFPLKRRILSGQGHLSNTDCAALAEKLVAHGTETVILGHISRHNNTPAMALRTVSDALREALPELLQPELSAAPECGPLAVEVKVSAPCSL